METYEMPNEQRYTPSIDSCYEMGNRGITRNNRQPIIIFAEIEIDMYLT